MNYDNIEQLLDKYEQGNCSPQETEIVESFLLEAEQESIPGYDDFVEKEREISSSVEIEDLLTPSNDMDVLLDRYEREIASTEEINQVESFLEAAEQDMHPSYVAFIENERLLQSELDVAEFVEQEDMGPLYNHFVEKERLRKCNIDVAALVASLEAKSQEDKEEETKVIPMRSNGVRWKSLAGMAAMFVLVVTAFLMIPDTPGTDTDSGYAVVNGVQIDDPEEAMSYALAALGKTGKKFQKGTDNMELLKDLKHTSIFK